MNKNKINSVVENLFTKFETRFRRKEKNAFLEYCIAEFKELGYNDEEITVQKSKLGKNLIVGRPDADTLVTAHYDTPANNGFLLCASPIVGQVLANVFTVLIFGIIALAVNIVSVIISVTLGLEDFPFTQSYVLIALFICSFLIKNKHNHNDNTSGVIGVFNIAAIAAENPELRNKCAFVLFDNEEWGLLGSQAFSKWRNKNFPDKKNVNVINLDCIGNSDILLVAAKNRHEGLDNIADFLQKEDFDVVKKRSMMIYLSDHAHFERGVMLSFVKESKLKFIYMPKVHTNKDTFCDLPNIERLSASLCKYICKINGITENQNENENQEETVTETE